MERAKLSEGMAVAVKRETGSRRSRFPLRHRATIIDLHPDPRRPDRVQVRFDRGGTSMVRIHQLSQPIERLNP